MCPWKELTKPSKISLLGLKETLEGGQSFSWNSTSKTSWIGTFDSKLVELKLLDNTIHWRTSLQYPATQGEVLEYLWLDNSYDEAVYNLPWRSDSVLAQCVQSLPGLTILNQPLGEMLFYFLLSSAKSIPQIKELGFLVCQKFGTQLTDDIWSFPGWEILSEVKEDDLRSLKLGYRAKYVHEVSRILKKEPGFLHRISELPYQEAKSALVSLPGVGPKIADCALLFGAKKPEAFPVDTWITKTLNKHYKLDSFNSGQKVLFARSHFGKFCGLAQQFLFSGERLGLINAEK
jgi:N-glycosylase/DNA lyase